MRARNSFLRIPYSTCPRTNILLQSSRLFSTATCQFISKAFGNASRHGNTKYKSRVSGNSERKRKAEEPHNRHTRPVLQSRRDSITLRFPFQRRLERENASHTKIRDLILEGLIMLRSKVLDPSFVLSTGLTEKSAEKDVEKFCSNLKSLFNGDDQEWNSSDVYLGIRKAYGRDGHSGVEERLQFLLQGFLANGKIGGCGFVNQEHLADLRYPHEWYAPARELQRNIHLHIGPTNSGKTYHALKRLEQAQTGIYGGPLRLLAHEVFKRLNASGKPCNLITGDERIISHEEAGMSSCTVEMVPTGVEFEVAVIDEIQMIGHNERGWAWTQALLGLRAKEIHLCGEERVLPLIRELTTATGDVLHIHRYRRLSPLKTMSKSLEGNLQNLRKGDCVVMFSRRGIHAMKREIEKETGRKVAVVYGSLPPEIRAQQARLFNDQTNDYDILVASDAVGMGLNLNIKRIVFESTSKVYGGELLSLSTSDLKQIAGRAGRFRVALDSSVIERRASDTTTTEKSSNMTPTTNASALGLVTSLDRFDLPVIQRAMVSEAPPITSAGLVPPDNVIIRFASFFPSQTPLSYILLHLYETSKMHSRFHLCQVSDAVRIADTIQEVTGLSISDRLVFCAAPVSIREPGLTKALKVFARCVEKQKGGALLKSPALNLSLLDEDGHGPLYLQELEGLHKTIILYLWLSYRFSGVFISQAMAFHAKSIVEEKIERVLAEATVSQQSRERRRKFREQIILEDFQRQSNSINEGSANLASRPAYLEEGQASSVHFASQGDFSSALANTPTGPRLSPVLVPPSGS